MTSEVRRIGGLRPPAEVTGPLAEHAAAFKQMLIGQGHTRGTISAHLGLMSRVSRRLDVQGLPTRALADLAEVDRFFAERRAKGCRLRITARSLVPLLDFLRDRQVIGAPVVPAATPAEVLLAGYRTYLEQERAATAGTVVNFTKYAGIFLRTFPRLGTDAAQQADLAAALGRLMAAEVVTFLTGWASCRRLSAMIALVIFGNACFRWLRAGGAGEAAAPAAAGAGTAWGGGRFFPRSGAGLPVRAGAGEFPALGPLVLAGRSSCPVSCRRDSVSTDGGHGQRRARSAWRFWAVWRLRAPIAAAIWDQVAPPSRAASMNASSPCSSSAASFRAAVIAARAAAVSMPSSRAVPLMPARAVAAAVSGAAVSLSWYPGCSPSGGRPPVVDVLAAGVLAFAVALSGGIADVLVTGPGGG